MKARHDVSRMRKLMISSAPARRDTKLAILEHFSNSQLYELYGSTEAGWVTLLRPDEQITHLGSVGREWTGSGPVRLLDPDGRDVPDGEVGRALFAHAVYVRRLLEESRRRRPKRCGPTAIAASATSRCAMRTATSTSSTARAT